MKAILIIDEMPNNCDDCPCAFYTEGAYCDYCKAVEGIKEIEYQGKNRPSWCPLITEEQYIKSIYPILYDSVVSGVLSQRELANKVDVIKVGEEE